MKKLFLILLVALTIGCEAAPECECNDRECNDKDSFFETHYAECVSMCETCSAWARMCGYEALTKDTCVQYNWNKFTPLEWCVDYETYAIEWLSNDDCISWEAVHDWCQLTKYF